VKGGLAALVVTGALIALPAIASAGPADPGGVCTVPKRLGIVFVIDDSGSMADNDPNALRGAATDIGIAQLPDGAVAAVSRFSDEAESIFGPAELNAGSRDASRRAVGSALESLGGTDYDQAFAQAKRQLDAMQGVDRRAVVFLSDGEPNEAYTADQPIAAAGIPIFTLGFAEAPPAELGGIAQRSGGSPRATPSTCRTATGRSRPWPRGRAAASASRSRGPTGACWRRAPSAPGRASTRSPPTRRSPAWTRRRVRGS
jgi:hypothetical protein